MKKLLLLALTLPVFVVVMGGADCSGGGTTCTSDADCADATNSTGEATPYCDVGSEICVPDMGECTEELDCQLLNPDSATSTEDHACEATADCDAGDVCVETTTGFHKCATTGNATVCGEIDTDAVSVTDTEGADATVCLAGGTCENNGACTF